MTTSNFETKTYNGVSIIVNTDDGYVNASKMVQVLRGAKEDTQFRRFLRENKSWKEYLDAFERKKHQRCYLRHLCAKVF